MDQTKHIHFTCHSSRYNLIIIIWSNRSLGQLLQLKRGIILVVAFRPIIWHINCVILKASGQQSLILLNFLLFLGFGVRGRAIDNIGLDFSLQLSYSWVDLILQALSLIGDLLLYQIYLIVYGPIALSDPWHLLHGDALLNLANLVLHILIVPILNSI